METDEYLMRRVREGEVRNLGPLFERHHVALFNFFVRLGGREAGEDLVQEVFWRMLQYRHTYRDEGCFVVWMYQIARRVWADHWAKSGREQPAAEGPLPVSLEPTPEEHLDRGEEVALLKEALAQLAPELREMLVLSRFQQMKYAEIAAVYACPVSTVKTRVRRGLIALRNIYFGLSEK